MSICDDVSAFERVSVADAISLLDDAYGDYGNPGTDYTFAKDVLNLNGAVVFYAGNTAFEMMFIPYPDDIKDHLEVPTALDCDMGLTIDLSDVRSEAQNANDCTPCRACDGATGNCCTCACISGCGTCFGGGCATQNCCNGGEIWETPQEDCSSTPDSMWEDSSALTTINIGGTL